MTPVHPFYIAGDYVWRAGSAVLILAAVFLGHWFRVRRLARLAALERAQFPRWTAVAVLQSAIDRDVCVRGTLVHGPVSNVTASGANEGLAVEVDGVTIPLVGRVEVRVGARVAYSGTPQRHAVGDGDEVLAYGARVAHAASPPRGYRDGSYVVQLDHARAHEAVRIAAVGNPRLVGVPWRRRALDGVVGVLFCALIFGIGGRLALAVSHTAPGGSEDGLHSSAAALAAATPFHGAALREAIGHLGLERSDVDPARVARARRLLEMLGDCQALAELDAREGDPEAAMRRCRACGIPPVAEALFAAGRLAQASRAYDAERPRDGGQGSEQPWSRSKDGATWLHRAEADLAVHAYGEAADDIVAYAAVYDPSTDSYHEERAAALRCLGDAIRARGDGGAEAKQRLYRAEWPAMCRVLAADLAPKAERAKSLENLDFIWRDNQGMEFAKLTMLRTAQALLEEAGPRSPLAHDVYRYAFYPDAYLPRNADLPPQKFVSSRVTDMGDDIANAEYHERTHLVEHPFAIFAAMFADGRGTHGIPMRFVCMCSDISHSSWPRRATPLGRATSWRGFATCPMLRRPNGGAARTGLPASLFGIGLNFARSRRWWRSSRGRLMCARSTPAACCTMRWMPWSAATEPSAVEAVSRFRAVLLDRDIAVPLVVLEAFGRRQGARQRVVRAAAPSPSE